MPMISLNDSFNGIYLFSAFVLSIAVAFGVDSKVPAEGVFPLTTPTKVRQQTPLHRCLPMT